MSDDKNKTKPELLSIHFDVKDHYINKDNHVLGIEATSTIIDELNKRLFDGKLEYEVLVFPSEEGSFKTKLAVKISTVAMLALTLSENGLFKGIVNDLTGAEWDNYTIGQNIGGFLRDTTKRLFVTDVSTLEKIIPSSMNFDKILKVKSDFYNQCIENEEVKALGFDDTENFPIKRNQFFNHIITKDKIRPLVSDLFIVDATIISPVDVDKDKHWELENRKTNKVIGKKISAYMHDIKFKKDFLEGKYPLKKSHNPDTLKVLLEYKKQERNGEIEIRERCINTVYSFNGKELTKIPENFPVGKLFQNVERLPMDDLWGNSI